MVDEMAAWTWEEADTAEDFECRSLVDTGIEAPLSAEELISIGVRGVQFGSWDGRVGGWLNTDAVGLRCGGVRTEPGRVYLADDSPFIQADAREPLPFTDDAVEWVYAEHFIEHLSPQDGIAWLREVRRILAPDGLVRLTTPDLAKYVDGYREDNGFYAAHRERLLQLGAPAQQVPTRRAFMLNQIFHYHGHQWIYDEEELAFALTSAGFDPPAISRHTCREGSVAQVAALDRPVRDDETFYVEARAARRSPGSPREGR